MIFVPLRKCRDKPLLHIFGLLDGSEDRENLLIQFRFGDPNAGMLIQTGDRAAVVDVLLAGFGLDDLFTGNQVATVAAPNQAARVGELMGFVRLATQQCLHPVPRPAIYQRFMLAGIPMPFVFQLSDVGPVEQDVVDTAAGEQMHARAELATFSVQSIHQGIDGQRFEGEQFEHAADVVSRGNLNLHYAATFLADVAVAVGGFTQEPSLLNAAGVALPHINGLLLGVKAGHVGQRPSHHAASGIAVSRLGDRDERYTVFRFQPLKLHIIREVSGGTVYLVEQQAIQLGRMLLGIRNQFLERLAFRTFGGGFRDAKEPENLSAGTGGVPPQRILLHFQ